MPITSPTSTWVPAHPKVAEVKDSDSGTMIRVLGQINGDPLMMMAPTIAKVYDSVSTTVRGFFHDPLHARSERDRLRALSDRSFEVTLKSGASMTAADRMSGHFMACLMPKWGDMSRSSIKVSIPSEGNSDPIVETNAHSPYERIGFYNAPIAIDAVRGMRRVVQAVTSSSSASRVNQLRAQAFDGRLEKVEAELDRFVAAAATRPPLQRLADAARHAHDNKRPDDANAVAYKQIATEVEAYLAAGADGLDSALIEHARGDLDVLARDHDKWIAWHGSCGISTYYVTR